MTLRWRVAFWSLTILGVTQLVFLGLASGALEARVEHDVWERASSRASQICALLQHEDRDEFADGADVPAPSRKGPLETLEGVDEILQSPGALAAFAFDGALISIRDGQGERIGLPALRRTMPIAASAGGPDAASEDAGNLVIAEKQVRVLTSHYAQPLKVIVGWPLGPAQRTLRRVEQMLVALTGLMLLLAGSVTFAMAGRALAPLTEISRQADAYSVGELSRRLPGGEHGDEVGRLAMAFNRLLARLEDAFQRERRFTADAAHELRTPLTILRGEVELALREHPESPAPIRTTLGSLKEEIEHLEGLVANLLTLARSEAADVGIEAEAVSLLESSTEVIGRLSPLARVHGVGLDITPESTDERVLGDPTTLRQAIFNLVHNGVRHSPYGSTVQIRVARSHDGAVLEVLDAGPGIPDSALPHLFDRFFRTDPSRTRPSGPHASEQWQRGNPGQGLGLGLAITRAVVQAHGGDVRAENLPGCGAKFTIRLPAFGG
jgi:heavy metal sensor kinase